MFAFESLGPAPKEDKKSLKLVLAIGALAGVIALGSTLAANINLNNGGNVEFGQGIAQTTACDNSVILTPQSTFVNDAENPEYIFTSFSVSDISSNCSGKTFTIKAYKNGQNSPLDLYRAGGESGPIYNEVKVIDENGNFSLVGGGLLSNDIQDLSTTGFNVELVTNDVPAVALASAQDVDRITIESSSTQAAPAGYEVGDIGPGGGIVFYVSANFFTSTGSTCETQCKYLEVAPATWQSEGASVANDSAYQWLDDRYYGATGQDKTTASNEGYSQYETVNWKIGQGHYNTSVMKVPDAISSDAQAAVLAYAGRSTAGQWFIPSMNELNELCKYARGQTTGDPKVACDSSGTLKVGTANNLGGFVENYYWSSTEYNYATTRLQIFTDGFLNIWPKDFGAYIRPIRAF
jgi:hypothetical protein